MISRLMINLRDPTLHNPADCDTTSHDGYVSTFVLDDMAVATQTESNSSVYDAWSVVFNRSHSYRVDIVYRS
jgi:hypothetical protein